LGLRILHSIRSVNPTGGGPIEGVKQISSVNCRHGHSVEVLCLDSPKDPWVKDFPLPCHAMGPSLLGYGYSPKLVPWLRAHCRSYDVVVVNGIWQYNAFGVWRALHGGTTPYCVFTHGMLDPWFKDTYPLKHVKKWLYWPWADYRVLRDAAAVLFTCEEERRLAQKSFWLYRCNEHVISYGTARPKGSPESQLQQFQDRFPELSRRRCLLFLGRVHEKKGPDLLFHAFAAILRTLPSGVTKHLHLTMAGPDDHPYAKQMKNLAVTLGIADRVTWTGMLTGDLKWGAFHASDAFVLPSHQENFGIAVTEALACGVPVLISDKINIWQEIARCHAGLAEPDDLEGTARLLRRWLDMPEGDREEMRKAARACFSANFDIEHTAASFSTMLNSLDFSHT